MNEKLKEKFKYVVFAVVLLIPFMYSFFYLKSYWDPYGNLSDLGVAIVNNDNKEDNSLSEKFVNSLKDSDSCKFEVVNSSKANDGLTNGDYYAIITIPENFTENINNAGEKNRSVTTITYAPNQKSNYLASQIISRVVLEAEKGLEGEISSAVVGSLVDNLNEVPKSLQTIVDATDKLQEGSDNLKSGLGQINEGTKTLSNKYTELDQGIDSVKNGASSLNDGVNDLKNGSSKITSGLSDLNNGVNSYTTNTTNLVKLLNYCEVVHNADGSLNLNTQRNQYIKSAYNIDCNNISLLMNGLSNQATVSKLNSGASTLLNGSKSLDEGISKLQNGTSTLQSGLDKVSSGSKTVKDSLTTLSNGTSSAYDGSVKLSDGLSTFKGEIVKSKTETEEKLSKLDGLDTYVKDSVKIDEKPKGKVKQYGVSFTPLFLSIGLWVGALMCYVIFYYDQEHRFKLLDKENRGIKQNFAYILIASIFALVTSFLIKTLLGFSVTSSVTYYLSSILISVTFMSIIQLLIRLFSDVGKFLSLVVLVLQLAASGGTFPVETITYGFRWLNPLLPMTYSIKLIKEALISTDNGFIFNNAIVLILFAVISFLITCTYDYIKGKNKGKEENKKVNKK